MKRVLFISALSVITLRAAAQNNILTQTVKGTVIDEQSGSVLSNATVLVESSSKY
jgi:hypothetical protein